MGIYSRILIAVDDKEISKKAMQEAIQLTKDQKAKLYIIYIADEFLPAGEGIPVDFEKHIKTVRKHGLSILKTMSTLATKAKIDFKTHLIEVKESSPIIAEKIIEQGQTWKADLIILGTHGRTGLSRLLLGSVAEDVARKSNIPVQLVKAEEKK